MQGLIKTGDFSHKKIEKISLIKRIQKSTGYTIFYIIFTFYALFADDIRHFVSNNNIDNIFYIIFLLTFLFFVVDMIFLTKTRKNYFLSILFFLDFVGTFSLLLDIGWFNQYLFDRTDMNVYGVLARGARSALLANSAFKYLEVLRYLKKIRLSNLFTCSVFHHMKHYLKKKEEKEKKRLQNYKRDKIIFEEDSKKKEPKIKTVQDIYKIGKEMKEDNETTISNSGQEMSILFTERITIIILLLMCLLPTFYVDSYFKRDLMSYKIDLNTIQYYIDNVKKNSVEILKDDGFKDMWEEYQKNDLKDDYDFIKLILYEKDNILKETPSSESITIEDINENFRYYELRYFSTGNVDSPFKLVSYFSLKTYLNKDAILNILRTFFVLILLFVSVYLYSVEVNNLLIEPLEKMMDNIFEMNKNPIEGYKKIKSESKKEEEKNVWDWGKQEMDELIEKLYKTCKLLSLGFGEAGNNLIVKQLKGNKNLSFNQGKKIFAVFGFCHIRNFSKFTEDLRDDILEFVNSIAYIVHSNAEKNHGKVNKNIGDTFLIVWKFNDTITEYLLRKEKGLHESIHFSDKKQFEKEITKKCEYSIKSFIHTLISIRKMDYLKVLKKKQKNALKINKIKNYQVQMSFGLHMGYAIEGAIGSNHKIDLSYLSPHVNLASRVMAVTSQYDVNLFISGKLIDYVSKNYKDKFRIVDIVFLKGSKQPVKLFTFDLDRSEKTLNKILTFNFQDKNKEIEILRQAYDFHFFKQWNEGFKFYFEGKWNKAYSIFTTLKTFINEYDDGPCLNLIKFIEENDFKPPQDWNGIRSLLKK